jgi:acyl-CoA synthetase (AMP-forming)/AMP-acid ligase II
MKFFPQEVEAVLCAHPSVAEACVFACGDARLGEVAVARVVPKDLEYPPNERELLGYCRKHLAAYKVPQRIEFVPALSRTPSGKLLHRQVNQRVPASHDLSSLGIS